MNSKHTRISKKAEIGENLRMGHNNIIEEGATIGDNVCLGNNVTIKKGVEISDGCVLEDNVIVGYQTLTRIYDEEAQVKRTIIGKHTLIRPHSMVYIGCHIGENSTLHHNVVLREATIIGHHTSISCMVKSDGYLTIGNHCSIHELCHLTPFMKIEDDVFMAPGVISLNDATIDYERTIKTEKKGPWIKFGARIGGNVTLCPGVIIGREAFITAGSLVTRDVPDYCKAGGVPAKIRGKTKDIEKIKSPPSLSC